MIPIFRLKACLNGSRKVSEHQSVPVTPSELATAASDAVAAGAEAIHMHPRRADGTESLAASDIADAVREVRAACPGIPIGVSTGLWIVHGDVSSRRVQVAAWADLDPAGRPDFASVNVKEAGFAELADVLQAGGIGVEAGVWSSEDADALADVTPRLPWLRVLVEIMNAPADEASTIADTILERLDTLHVDGPRLLHGEGRACWALVAHASRLGLPTRIGLEDSLSGPDGKDVTDNAALVHLGLEVWSDQVH